MKLFVCDLMSLTHGDIGLSVIYVSKQQPLNCTSFLNTTTNEPVHVVSNNVVFDMRDSDKPRQPPFKLRNSKWCSVSSLTITEYSSD